MFECCTCYILTNIIIKSWRTYTQGGHCSRYIVDSLESSEYINFIRGRQRLSGRNKAPDAEPLRRPSSAFPQAPSSVQASPSKTISLRLSIRALLSTFDREAAS